MSTKRLRRIDISQELHDRLTRKGFQTCGDVLCKSPLEMMKLIGCCGETVDDLYHKCCLLQAARPVTALELFRSREKKSGFFPTSLADLDAVLHGGLPAGTITEITGPAGCGKTQLCMTLSVLATLPIHAGGLEGSVIYIDTEGAFSADRLIEIAENRCPQHFPDEDHLRCLANSVHISLVQTCAALLYRLQNLEEDIISKNVRLIVLDSVASLVRKEFSSIKGGMIRRTDFLATEAALLKYIAEAFSLPIVVTNQITTRYGDKPTGYSQLAEEDCNVEVVETEQEGESGHMVAALGNTWSHSVNTRLILQFRPPISRQILVAKSPVAPFTCFDFTITSGGVYQSAEGQGHYIGTDPSKQAIQGRRGISFEPQL